MNSELYFCQLSDLIVSRKANTVMTSEGNIKNLLPEEALVDENDLLQPLPWIKYSHQEVKHYLAQLKTKKWLSLSHLKEEFLVRIQSKCRLTILNNFFKSEDKTWKPLKNLGQTTHILHAGTHLLLTSISATETYLSIPNRFSNYSCQISLPTNFCLLIDPYFQDKFYHAVFFWIKFMTEKLNNTQLSSNEINDCLELVKLILQDISNSVVDISNEVEAIKFENQKLVSDRDDKFSFILNYENGLSIQLSKRNSHKSQRHIRNLDINPRTLLENPDEWTNILQDLIQMHMLDINLSKQLNFQ